MQDSFRTYQTRPRLCASVEDALYAYAELFARIEHSLFADICKGKTAHGLKSAYVIKYGITARQFNAIRVKVEGKIASIKELNKLRTYELQEQIKTLEVKITKLEKKRLYFQVHQKKRRLHQLRQRLEKLIEDQKQERVSLCFGSKKLFREQFYLRDNGYQAHEEWLSDWRHARTSEIFFLGSKDEAAGNQSCTATLEEDKTLQLRIRMPNALHQFGKYITIPHVTFSYGHDEIVASLIDCEQRKLLSQSKNPASKNHGQAITYRFVRDSKGWRLFVSTSLPMPTWKTRRQIGVIGVDINSDHLAYVETDRFGNPIFKKTTPLHLYGKRKQQSLALIGDACAEVVAHAENTLKPIVLENLDFQRKKQSIRETHTPSQARMLSSFSYRAILTHIQSRAFSKQVEVHQVNPAFTSIIGRVKFASRYGLSVHHAAALCIGRRFLCFSEKVPRCLDNIPDGRDSHVALPLPVRNRSKHVWHLWRGLSKNLPVALQTHFRAKRSSSTCKATLGTALLPDFAGVTPAYESSTQLLG